MLQRELTLSLPEDLASEAESAGQFNPEQFNRLLREELRRRRVDRLFKAADCLADSSEPLKAAEIEAELEAARRQRRAADAGCA